VYALFFISDFGLSNLYDPSRYPKPPDSSQAEMFGVTILSPLNEQVTRFSILNVSFQGKALSYAGERKITLNVTLNDTPLIITEGNPIVTETNGPISAALDLMTFHNLAMMTYKVTVTAVLGKRSHKKSTIIIHILHTLFIHGV
jgi:hypothetical protein